MKTYNAIFFDADETLLDFKRSEKHAFYETAKHWHLNNAEQLYPIYSAANKKSWELFELGEITKERLVIYRFERFFENAGLRFSAKEWNTYYKSRLGNTAFLLPGAIEVLEFSKKICPLYMVTNGLNTVQQSRIKLAGIGHYFTEIFTSEVVGAQKPQKEFFDAVFNKTGVLPEKTLLIGDSLTSDIIGGIRYGIDTCFINWNLQSTEYSPTYEVENLSELLALLQKFGDITGE